MTDNVIALIIFIVIMLIIGPFAMRAFNTTMKNRKGSDRDL